MIFNSFAILVLLEVLTLTRAAKRQIFSFDLDRGPPIRFPPSSSDPAAVSGQQKIAGVRRQRRCLSSFISLLWPQVVGPVDQGRIEEKSFEDLPKTILEYRLDAIRKKAREDEEGRLAIRHYLKSMADAQDEFYGYPDYGKSPGKTFFDTGENSIRYYG